MLSSYWCDKCKEYYEYEEHDITQAMAMDMDEDDMPRKHCPKCGSMMFFDEISL